MILSIMQELTAEELDEEILLIVGAHGDDDYSSEEEVQETGLVPENQHGMTLRHRRSSGAGTWIRSLKKVRAVSLSAYLVHCCC